MRKVASRSSQHSKMLGQPASWQTVCRPSRLHQALQLGVLRAHLRPGLDPLRLALDRGLGVADLEAQQLAALGCDPGGRRRGLRGRLLHAQAHGQHGTPGDPAPGPRTRAQGPSRVGWAPASGWCGGQPAVSSSGRVPRLGDGLPALPGASVKLSGAAVATGLSGSLVVPVADGRPVLVARLVAGRRPARPPARRCRPRRGRSPTARSSPWTRSCPGPPASRCRLRGCSVNWARGPLGSWARGRRRSARASTGPRGRCGGSGSPRPRRPRPGRRPPTATGGAASRSHAALDRGDRRRGVLGGLLARLGGGLLQLHPPLGRLLRQLVGLLAQLRGLLAGGRAVAVGGGLAARPPGRRPARARPRRRRRRPCGPSRSAWRWPRPAWPRWRPARRCGCRAGRARPRPGRRGWPGRCPAPGRPPRAPRSIRGPAEAAAAEVVRCGPPRSAGRRPPPPCRGRPAPWRAVPSAGPAASRAASIRGAAAATAVSRLARAALVAASSRGRRRPRRPFWAASIRGARVSRAASRRGTSTSRAASSCGASAATGGLDPRGDVRGVRLLRHLGRGGDLRTQLLRRRLPGLGDRRADVGEPLLQLGADDLCPALLAEHSSTSG